METIEQKLDKAINGIPDAVVFTQKEWNDFTTAFDENNIIKVDQIIEIKEKERILEQARRRSLMLNDPEYVEALFVLREIFNKHGVIYDFNG